MENNLSGSLGFDFIDEVSELVNTKQYEEGAIESFSENFYVLNKLAPDPFWAYSLNFCRLIKLNREIEVIPIESFDSTAENTECYVNQNIVMIPTAYISELEWH